MSRGVKVPCAALSWPEISKTLQGAFADSPLFGTCWHFELSQFYLPKHAACVWKWLNTKSDLTYLNRRLVPRDHVFASRRKASGYLLPSSSKPLRSPQTSHSRTSAQRSLLGHVGAGVNGFFRNDREQLEGWVSCDIYWQFSRIWFPRIE